MTIPSFAGDICTYDFCQKRSLFLFEDIAFGELLRACCISVKALPHKAYNQFLTEISAVEIA
ncbi:MAG: hypothetical protein F6J96_02115 [Symploca sp. SIO1C2]|nr:hypothetical protein [Symploca sp. SIO1C2]